jgi:hypothetical protein
MKAAKWIVCSLFVVFVLLSCTQRKGKDAKIEEESAKKELGEEPVKTVVEFLNWYRTDYDSINGFEMVNWRDTTVAYSVNFEGTEKYLEYLKKSGYISDEYVQRWRGYFKECEENFKKNPQKDGPPEGFEFDFILWTQTIDETLESIDNPRLISKEVKDNEGVVNIDISMRLSFHLKKFEGKWKIDRIENLGMD